MIARFFFAEIFVGIPYEPNSFFDPGGFGFFALKKIGFREKSNGAVSA